MGLFGGKKTAAVDEGEMGPGMVNMLASMPSMMRKQMMRGRITGLLSYTEERRQEAIRGMFRGFHNPGVKDKNREKVIATRVEIIGELPEDKRRTIIASRIVALKADPNLSALDLKVQEKVLGEVNPKARQAFLDSWSAVTSGSRN